MTKQDYFLLCPLKLGRNKYHRIPSVTYVNFCAEVALFTFSLSTLYCVYFVQVCSSVSHNKLDRTHHSQRVYNHIIAETKNKEGTYFHSEKEMQLWESGLSRCFQLINIGIVWLSISFDLSDLQIWTMIFSSVCFTRRWRISNLTMLPNFACMYYRRNISLGVYVLHIVTQQVFIGWSAQSVSPEVQLLPFKVRNLELGRNILR